MSFSSIGFSGVWPMERTFRSIFEGEDWWTTRALQSPKLATVMFYPLSMATIATQPSMPPSYDGRLKMQLSIYWKAKWDESYIGWLPCGDWLNTTHLIWLLSIRIVEHNSQWFLRHVRRKALWVNQNCVFSLKTESFTMLLCQYCASAFQ